MDITLIVMIKLKSFLLPILTALLFPSLAYAIDYKGNQRTKYNFNSDWSLYVGDQEGAEQPQFNDKNWKRITLPHAYNEDDAFKLAIDKHTTGIVWYRKHFKLPASDKNKKVFLEFEGIRFGGDFYINGTHIGIHENGVMACGFDITNYLHYGKENVVAVRIDNAWNYKEKATGSVYQWNDKNFNANYGGIPKNVYLHTTPKLYQTLPLYSNLKTTGTYIYAREINISRKSATIHAQSEIKNEYGVDKKIRFEVEIEDMDGKVVKRMASDEMTVAAGAADTIKAEGKLDNIHFWNWGYGYLYNVYTILYVDNTPIDVVKTRTGFRKTAFRDGMVYLNDRVLQMKGYAQRTSNEWPSVGMSIPAWLSDYSNQLMVKGNANLVRWMHVTPWKQDVESCDRVGLIQAMPAGDSERDADGRRWELRVELMRDAIIYNRNNPSILFYESGNKGVSEEHMAEMKAIRDQYDPYGGRAIGSREMLDSKIAEYGGEMLYINKSARIPMWATEYCRDEALRKYWDEYSYPFHKNGAGPDLVRSASNNQIVKMDASAYNRNQDSFTIELINRWYDYYRVRPGTGTRVSSGGVKIIFSDSNTHYRGEENYRRSGVTDAMRIEKDGFFAHQIMWDGWVDIENYGTHIVGHWNYTPEVKKDIFVVSSGEQVELRVNGQSKGMGKRSSHFLFIFKDVQWEKGKIEAISYDSQKKEVSRHEIKTAGAPASLQLSVIQAPDGFKADGADLAMVQVEVVDKDGLRCPLANDRISFTIDGPAQWRGGIAQGPDNYILSTNLPVECGINRALVRSTQKSGTIKITAKAEGLPENSILLHSIPMKSANGLSTYISGENQPSNLSRGEELGGQSYKDSRRSIKIVDAIAESNQDKVHYSFDDNERTEWSNNGLLKTGWIIYELERDATVSEVELKLAGWRTRSYTIQIFVDDKMVYNGETEKSLGYVALPVTPTKGRFVKIQLLGVGAESDAFGGIVEVTGKIEEDGISKSKDPKGQLSIVEAEVYERNN